MQVVYNCISTYLWYNIFNALCSYIICTNKVMSRELYINPNYRSLLYVSGYGIDTRIYV